VSWHETSYRANLIDMHIPDWNPEFLGRFDPEEYVRMLELAHVDTAYLYTSSCLGICYWPTRIGHLHGGVKGRDVIRELTTLCHARGMRVVLYFNFWSKWAYTVHPDWRMVNSRGQGTAEYLWTPGHYGVCCLNSPYREFMVEQIRDLCSSYDFEGLWIDMIFWPYTVCYCGHCRRRYFEERRAELPRTVDWDDPAWVTFQRARERWLAEFVGLIGATAKRARPGISVGHQCAAWSVGWAGGIGQQFFREMDYLAGDFYGGPAEQAIVCELFSNLTERKLYEFMTSRCPDLNEHTTNKSVELLRAQAFATLARNGRFLFIDAIDPAGTLDPMVYETMGGVYRDLARYEPCLQAAGDLEACRDVALYVNFDSLVNPADTGRAAMDAAPGALPLVRSLQAAAKTLLAHHVPFTVITPRNLGELDRYQVVMLLDLPMMSQAEVDALRAYVSSGGGLFVTRDTSIRRSDGTRPGGFMLAELLGLEHAGQTVETATYIAPTEAGADRLRPFTALHPLSVRGPMTLVRPTGAHTVLGTVTLPYTDMRDPDTFGSAISNPPGRPTDRPALVLRSHGRGKVLYSAGAVELWSEPAQRAILCSLLDALRSGPYCLEVSAPSWVQATMYRQPGRSRFLVHLLSFPAELPGLPPTDIVVRCRLGGAVPTGVSLAPEGRSLPFRAVGEQVEFTVPRLDTYALCLVQCGSAPGRQKENPCTE
jgi:hypothetical protein